MFRKSRPWIFVGLILSLLFAGGVYVIGDGDEVLLSSSYGDPHTTGVYSTGGNAGEISFDDATLMGAS
jgi:hypothetical protein